MRQEPVQLALDTSKTSKQARRRGGGGGVRTYPILRSIMAEEKL